MNLFKTKDQILSKAALSSDYRSRLLLDPVAVIEEETGYTVPEGFTIEASEDGETGVELIICSGETALDESELQRIVGGTGGNEHQGHTIADDEAWEAQWGGTPPWHD